MTTPAPRTVLLQWSLVIAEADKQIDVLSDLTGSAPESPLMQAITNMQEAYTAAVAELVGDAAEWLQWYWLDNDMGAKAAEAGPNDDMRPIRNIEDLAWLLGLGATP